jgi:hypothetical protein
MFLGSIAILWGTFFGGLWVVNAATETNPKLPANVSVDFVLLKYHGNIDGVQWLDMDKYPGGCVITYPDSYVPIIVPKTRLEEVKKLLGDSEICILRDGLK